MNRLARWVIAMVLLVGALMLASCGEHHTTKVVHQQASVPKQDIGTAPETSRVPEDADGAARLHSQFLEPGESLPFAFTGSQIHLDAHGALLIENFEETQKSVYCPYWDAYGHVWTRGFGETDWSGNFGGRCISHAQATHNLVAFVETKYQYAVRSLGINLNQCQVNASDSLVWNLGPGVLLPGGSLRGAFQRHEWSAILGYDHAGGVVLSGLARRRQIEYHELTRSCPYGETPAQQAARIKHERRVKLGHDYGRRLALNKAIAANHCLNPRGYGHYSKHHREACIKWRAEHAAVNRDIKRLHALGI